MAHMGATIEQPAKQAGFGPALAAATLVIVIGLVIAMAAWVVGSNLANGSSATDRSYNQIESLRGATTLSAAGDASLDKVEDIRGGAFLPAKSGDFLPANRNLDSAVRGGWFVTDASFRNPPLSGNGVIPSNQDPRGLHGALP